MNIETAREYLSLIHICPDGEKTDQPGVEYISWPGSYPIDCDAFMNDDINETAGKGKVHVCALHALLIKPVYCVQYFRQQDTGIL